MADSATILNGVVSSNDSKTRQSWVLSSSYSVDNNIPAIQMSVNPTSVKFSQSKRISTPRKTIGGTTYFHWSDSKGRNLDLLTLTISGETGAMSGLGNTAALQSLTSVIKSNGKLDPKAAKNAQNWAAFYTLTTQPAIDPTTLKRNIWTIQYRSMLFPNINMRGFFLNVLDFSDSALEPFSKKYTALFVVTKVNPDITLLQNLFVQAGQSAQTAQAIATAPVGTRGLPPA